MQLFIHSLSYRDCFTKLLDRSIKDSIHLFKNSTDFDILDYEPPRFLLYFLVCLELSWGEQNYKCCYPQLVWTKRFVS
jgi:hypothetical protein